MIEPKIIVDERPDPALRDAIVGPLRDYNTRKIGPIAVSPLAILLRHPESDAIIGGLWGQNRSLTGGGSTGTGSGSGDSANLLVAPVIDHDGNF